ncbi:hypothetical protein HYU16_02085 [Candidatus Woesearchaeota archaeon]|nr:hypothetical protein [Candidatus Woesearchaeota archaeon]
MKEITLAKNNLAKYVIGFVACFAIRLIPFRPPNIEPVMTANMPFSKKFGYLGGFAFGFLSITLFDLFTKKAGIWTLITAAAYGAVGIGAAWFFKSRKSSVKNYAIFSVLGTLAYDAATGLTIGPLFFAQPFVQAVTGQIPFTLLHLAGNLAFSVTLSPLLYSWVVENRSLETEALISKLKSELPI